MVCPPKVRCAACRIAPALLLALTIGLLPARAAVITVWYRATGTADGKTWGSAFTKVQAGIDAAKAGDEVWVAGGCYQDPFSLKDGVSVYGGFAGTETARDQRDWRAHSATFYNTTLYRPLVTASTGVGRQTVLDGLDFNYGEPALLCDGGSPTVRHCTFRYQFAYSGHESQDTGGAVTCLNGAAPRISNSLFATNEASLGGALYCVSSAPELVNNTLIYCKELQTSTATAGAIYITGAGAAPVFVNNIITQCGLVVMDAAAPGGATFRNNLFYANSTATTNGVASTFVGLPDPVGANGNINADPHFASSGHADYRIQADSPARNMGDGDAVLPNDTDMYGEARIQDDRVDIGMDESDGAVYDDPAYIIHVRPDGNNAMDGRTWATARKTLSLAASGLYTGDEIWVAAGTYASGSVKLPAGVGMYGGFAGTEESRGQRDPVKNLTTIGGANYGVGGTAAAPTVVDGFTVDCGVSGSCGLSLSGGWIVVGHNTFRDSLHAGTGTLRITGSTAVVRNNAFLRNTGGQGAAINASPSLTFSTEVADGPLALTIEDNVFEDNTAYEGGGIYLSSAKARVANNIFLRNTADRGAALFTLNSTLTLANNTVIACGSGNVYGLGGAVSLHDSAATVVNNVFADNPVVFDVDGADPTRGHNGYFNNVVYQGLRAGPPPAAGGNVTADPLFVDAPHGDYRVLPDSPYRDAGDDSGALLGDADLDGKPRIQGAHVDIGAYEFAGVGGAGGALDAASAARIAGGLVSASVANGGAEPAPVDIMTAVRLVRRAAGVDAAP
ncbi:MAG TPA: right-handed parallel beta-helix repeat-containing protein [Armatimonadota bacterium]|jgi:hypothetical protein